MKAAFASISAYGWNQLGSWLRRTMPIMREKTPSVMNAASRRSAKFRVGTFIAVSICPIREPVQSRILPRASCVRFAASLKRRHS